MWAEICFQPNLRGFTPYFHFFNLKVVPKRVEIRCFGPKFAILNFLEKNFSLAISGGDTIVTEKADYAGSSDLIFIFHGNRVAICLITRRKLKTWKESSIFPHSMVEYLYQK